MDTNDDAMLKCLIESMDWNGPDDTIVVDKSVPLSIKELKADTDNDDITSTQASLEANTQTQDSENEEDDVTSSVTDSKYPTKVTCRNDKSINYQIRHNDSTNPNVFQPNNNYTVSEFSKLGIDLNWSFNQGTKFFQSTIDNISEQSYREWYKPLWMDDVVVTTMSQSEKFHELLNSERRGKQVNILGFLHKSWIDLPPLFYFSSTKYPIEDGFGGKGWLALKAAIYRNAIACGFKLISNGTARNKNYPNNKTIRCNHAITYTCRKHKDIESTNYRRTTLCNDRLNSRGKAGLSQCRKSSSSRPMNNECTCSMYFMISYNRNGFFVVNGCGNRLHQYHPFIEQDSQIYPTNLLPSLEKEISSSINASTSNLGVSRDVIFHRTNVMLSLHNIRYLNKHILSKENDESSKDFKYSSADNILNYFRKNNIHYSCLLHGSDNGGCCPKVYTETDGTGFYATEIKNQNMTPEFMLSLSKKHQEDVNVFAQKHRNELELKNNQKLMMAIVWVTEDEKRLFKMYPNTIFCDVTSDTNKEKRPFFTVTGKDTMGKMFTILRAYLPNEQSWIFRWLFMTIFPQMFPRNILQKVKFICSDGDPQEFTQIDEAIARYFPKAKRGRCGWHINTKTWIRNGPKRGCSKCTDLIWQKHTRRLTNWIYSWMKPDCETKYEFELSKYLFFRYLRSPQVRNEIGTEYCITVENMVQQYIEVHEDKFVFHEKIALRHFNEYSNSCHEGTNKGLKFHSNKVGPQFLLENSAMRLTQQGKTRYQKFCIDATRQLTKNPVWNHSLKNLNNKIISRGLSLLTEEFNLHGNYENVRVEDATWYVCMNCNMDNGRKSSFYSVHPIYSRVRTVTVTKGFMKCSCKLFERTGLICRHMFNVMSTFREYDGPFHHDISVCWWTTYYKNAGMQTPLSQALEKLFDNDIIGPYIKEKHYDHLPLCLCPEHSWIRDDKYPVSVNIPLRRIEVHNILHSDKIRIGCSQVSSSEINAENNIEDYTVSPCTEIVTETIATDRDFVTKSPFDYLYPSFKELCSSSENVCSHEHLEYLKNWMNQQIIENV